MRRPPESPRHKAFAKDLAALVASKVYYHLGAFKESLALALGAGALFDVNEKSEYIETITGLFLFFFFEIFFYFFINFLFLLK